MLLLAQGTVPGIATPPSTIRAIEDREYIEMEDLQHGLKFEDTTVLDVKIGFQSFRADVDGVSHADDT